MKKTLGLMITLALATSMVALAEEKKNTPKPEAVEAALKVAGAEHNPEKMKVSKVGSIPAGATYYHAFRGSLKEGGYRIIFMDNTGAYLGYYLSEFEPVDFEEGAVLLDSGESDAEGNTTYFSIRIDDKGPADKIRIDGIPVSFVKAPGKDGRTAAGANLVASGAAGVNGESQIEYREWTITRGGQKIPVRALFVKEEAGKVYLKSEVNGKTVAFSSNEVSKEDQEYLKNLK